MIPLCKDTFGTSCLSFVERLSSSLRTISIRKGYGRVPFVGRLSGFFIGGSTVNPFFVIVFQTGAI